MLYFALSSFARQFLRSRELRCFALCACCITILILSPSHLSAQTGAATLSGTITDQKGALIPDVHVTITNEDTGISVETKTNGAGIYGTSGLNPGRYRVFVEKDGFKQVDLRDLTLNVQDAVSRNFTLEAGGTSETIQVNGSSANINTTDASVSTVIDRQFVDNLPLNGRSFQSLLYVTPGVAANTSSTNSNYSSYSQGQFVVNGQRGDANYWMVDGVSANAGIEIDIPGAGASGGIGATNVLGGTSALVSIDDMQEFRLQTSTYAPEFGRVLGGQISIQTRSGTNQFHGGIFEYLRNTDLDATDWFTDHYGLAKAAEIQNDFGGVIGGPIVRDKTFFFFSAEELRLIQPDVFIGTVPDLASRQAALPAMQPFVNAYPLPSPGATDVPGYPGLAPYSASFSNPSNAGAYSLRLDHSLFSGLNLFARYNYAPSGTTTRNTSGNPNNYSITKTVTKTATLGVTWTKSPQMVNDFRFNYSVSGGALTVYQDSFGGSTPLSGDNLFAPGYTVQNSDLIFIPLFGTYMESAIGLGQRNYQHQYNAVNALSVSRGAHSLKFGIDYRRLSPFYESPHQQLLPIFETLDGMLQGNTLETLVINNIRGTLLFNNLGVFCQDTWRVNSRLNITYGLRWDVDFLPTPISGGTLPAVTGFSTTNLSNLALLPLGTHAYATQYANIAPRIGGAYRIRSDPNWGLVVRGGVGLFYGLASTEALNANQYNDTYPFGAYQTYSGAQFPLSPALLEPPPIEPPNVNGDLLVAFDPHLRAPHALEWNLSLEQSLGSAQTFTLSYVGASDGSLIASEAVNNPNPNFSAVSLVGNFASSNYQALQVQFQRRLDRGLQSLLSYTWSHSIDDGSYGAYQNGSFADISANRGSSDYDLRQVFSGAVTYNIPTLKQNAATRLLTSGWSTDDILQFRSGPPVEIKDGNISPYTPVGVELVLRPDVVPGQPQYLAGPQFPGRKALNPAAFTDPPVDSTTELPLRQGTLGRNALRALGFTQWDFAAHRDFAFSEKVKLQFRAELFNILNHPNFAPYNNTFQTGNAYFGQATEMLNQRTGSSAGSQNPLYALGGPRSGEFALKLLF